MQMLFFMNSELKDSLLSFKQHISALTDKQNEEITDGVSGTAHNFNSVPDC